MVPKEVAALESQAVEIPDDQIATKPESPAQPPVEPVEEKAEVPIEQKTAPAVEEKKIVTAPPVEPVEKPVTEAKPVLEKKVVVPKEVPAPKPSEKPVVEKAEVSPKVSDEIKKDPEKLTINIQKENSQIASLPSSMVKPEIFRTDPAGRENVFNNSDYFFNRGIFFQQAISHPVRGLAGARWYERGQGQGKAASRGKGLRGGGRRHPEHPLQHMNAPKTALLRLCKTGNELPMTLSPGSSTAK